jgi:hypothetical protein
MAGAGAFTVSVVPAMRERDRDDDFLDLSDHS